MVTRADVVAEARSWVGTKWHHQGRTKGVACDCIGLVLCTARALGIFNFETNDYDRQPDGVTLQAGCDEHMDRIAIADIQPGDVLLMRFSRTPQHLGIVGDYPIAGNVSLIHAYAQGRAVCEHRLDDAWRNQIVQAYRLRGIE